METAIVKVNPAAFGLTEEVANNILKNLPTILEEREVMIEEYKRVITLDIDDPATAKAARENRLNIQKNRTKGIEVWHKVNKEYFLRGGQFIDANKRKECAENERMEATLMEIEKHREIKEQKRIAGLQISRQAETAKYEVDGTLMPLGQMTEQIWNDYISGVRLNYEVKKAAEAKAEADRIEKEKAEAAENERIRIENETLRKQNEAKEKQLAEERKASEAKAEKVRKEAEAKLKTERDAKAKLEKELKIKADAEAKAKREAEEKAETEANKGDADKVKDLITDLTALKTKYIFKSKKNKKMYENVGVLLEKLTNFIN